MEAVHEVQLRLYWVVKVTREQLNPNRLNRLEPLEPREPREPIQATWTDSSWTNTSRLNWLELLKPLESLKPTWTGLNQLKP